MSDKGEIGGWTRGLTYSLREIAPWQAKEREESCPSFHSRKSRGDDPLRRILLRNNRWGNRGTRCRHEVRSFCSRWADGNWHVVGARMPTWQGLYSGAAILASPCLCRVDVQESWARARSPPRGPYNGLSLLAVILTTCDNAPNMSFRNSLSLLRSRCIPGLRLHLCHDLDQELKSPRMEIARPPR